VQNKKTSEERNRLIRQALIQLFELQLHSGATSEELTQLAHACIAKARNDSSIRLSSSTILDAQDYGTVLKTWHRQAEYLSKSGLPRGLTVNGKFGLRKLIEHYYPKAQFLSVLASLRASGLIVQRPNGKWHPTDKCAVFPYLNPELLSHLSEGISLLIDTVSRNVTAKSREEALFERSSKVRFLPASQASEFRQFVSRQGSAFLGAVDDWLESRANAARSRRQRKCTAGAFAFAFVDESTQQPPVRVARRRKRR
jgi:hypothetical protein